MKGAELLVRCLEEEGVEYAFGVPGEETLDFVEALHASRYVRPVLNRHEQHAVFMAAAYGRLTGRAGVCFSTLGPGATNLTTGLAYARTCGFPVVALTGQRPARDDGGFRYLDVSRALEPVTKWSASVAEAETIPRHVRRAFQVAEGPRRGPAHLEIPEDVAWSDVDEVHVLRRPRSRPPVAPETAIEDAAGLVRTGTRPLLLLGSEANRPDLARAIDDFVTRTGIYTLTTQMGKGALRENHPRSLGSLALRRRDALNLALDEADVLLTVGFEIPEYPARLLRSGAAARLLHVGAAPVEPWDGFSPDLSVVGDVASTLERLSERLDERGRDDVFLSELRDRIRAELFESRAEDVVPLPPLRVVRDVRAALEPADVVCLDDGGYKIWFGRHFPVLEPSTLLLDDEFATMGAGLATAMTAKMLHRERRVLAVCGDGGFLMNSQDLETAVRLDLDLTVLVLRDEGYGMIRWKQQRKGFEEQSVDFDNPDFPSLAEAYGARGLTVTRPDGLLPALREALSFDAPALVDCPIDYSYNRELEGELERTVLESAD